MDRQAPAGLLGIHVNMPATVPEDVAKALKLIRIPLTSFGPSAYFVAPRREAAKGDLTRISTRACSHLIRWDTSTSLCPISKRRHEWEFEEGHADIGTR